MLLLLCGWFAAQLYILIDFFFFLNEGNGGRFSGGFDINVFEKVHKSGMIE